MALLLLVSQALYGWGPEGHRITGRIADEVRNQKPETGPWHYVNIPIDRSVFDRSLYCAHHQCVVGAIERFGDELKAIGPSPAAYEALFYPVHFIGDLHQPLHCGDRGDRGGNDVRVVFLGSSSNLHRVWDSGISHAQKLEYKMLRRISKAEKASWSRGTPDAWAMESHDLARDVAYRFPEPVVGPVTLDRSYLDAGGPVVREQLRKAGVRMAWTLNQAFE